MKQTLLTLAIVSILATGCGHAALATHTADTAASTPARAKADAKADAKTDTKADAKEEGGAAEESAKTAALTDAKPADLGADAAPEASPRKPGDFVIYRFSGSFRKTPLTISQRVIDKQGSILTVDVTAEAGGEKRELRVKLSDAVGAKNEIVSVARLEGGVEKPASPDVYEKLMAEAMLAADQNEAFLGAEDVVIDINGAPVPCHKASYRVRVGKKVATMQTLSSDGFAWGDVGGEITAASGKVLFRAEVVEAGHSEPGKGHAVANADVPQ